MVLVPGSKSHTIRAAAIALLAHGTSIIHNPLHSGDGLSALHAARELGATVEISGGSWKITGCRGKPKPASTFIDVGNSGTSLRLMTSIAALQDKEIVFDGDSSLRTRQMQPLLSALSEMGAHVLSANGLVPIHIRGPIHGTEVSVSGKTSQYLSSLLIVAPLLHEDTTIIVENLFEKPYVHMTLSWLFEQGISYQEKGMREFFVKGRQGYSSFHKTIPGDWSSAAFPLCAALVTGSTIRIEGLSLSDSQGDKAIITYLREMGADITIDSTGIEVRASRLSGKKLDLNDTPDMLPVMAVLGCFASGTTQICNAPQARIKETDRISVMSAQLRKMGATVEEKPDGMIIHHSILHGATVDGYEDHRIIMALACAGLGAKGSTIVQNAKNYDVTYPGFVESFVSLGA